MQLNVFQDENGRTHYEFSEGRIPTGWHDPYVSVSGAVFGSDDKSANILFTESTRMQFIIKSEMLTEYEPLEIEAALLAVLQCEERSFTSKWHGEYLYEHGPLGYNIIHLFLRHGIIQRTTNRNIPFLRIPMENFQPHILMNVVGFLFHMYPDDALDDMNVWQMHASQL